MLHDDLSDVCLDGVRLVSDDPREWVVPQSMGLSDSPFEWWERLSEEDLPLTERQRTALASADKLVELADGYVTQRNKRRTPKMLLHYLVPMTAMGLDIDQISRLSGVPVETVTADLGPDAELKVRVRHMALEGVDTREIEATLGVSNKDVRHWCDNAHLTVKSSYVEDPELKAKALGLVHEGGMSCAQAIEAMKQAHPEFKMRLQALQAASYRARRREREQAAA